MFLKPVFLSFVVFFGFSNCSHAFGFGLGCGSIPSRKGMNAIFKLSIFLFSLVVLALQTSTSCKSFKIMLLRLKQIVTLIAPIVVELGWTTIEEVIGNES